METKKIQANAIDTVTDESSRVRAPRLPWSSVVVGTIIGAAIASGSNTRALDTYGGAATPQGLEQQYDYNAGYVGPDTAINIVGPPKDGSQTPAYPKNATGRNPAPSAPVNVYIP